MYAMTSDPPPASDDHLVRQALAGGPEAFAGLVERYQRLVRALVARSTGGGAETEDLVQEVFADSFRQLDRLRHPERFKAWLIGIARNRARLYWRRRRVEQDALGRLARPTADSRPDELEAREEADRVLRALRTLPDETQAIVTLRYLEGRSAPEIGRILGLAPAAVRMRLTRALRTLRQTLETREDRP